MFGEGVKSLWSRLKAEGAPALLQIRKGRGQSLARKEKRTSNIILACTKNIEQAHPYDLSCASSRSFVISRVTKALFTNLWQIFCFTVLLYSWWLMPDAKARSGRLVTKINTIQSTQVAISISCFLIAMTMPPLCSGRYPGIKNLLTQHLPPDQLSSQPPSIESAPPTLAMNHDRSCGLLLAQCRYT
jgi:hypothetical protein